MFFADPHSPWQRPTNENTNGLLRQYFPKGTDLSRWSAGDLEAVALAINNRPRKIFGWKTPPKSSTSSYTHFNHPVLHRPVELAQYTSGEFARYCTSPASAPAWAGPGCAGTTLPPRASSAL